MSLYNRLALNMTTNDQITVAAGSTSAYPRHIEDLDINPADDGFIIYQPEEDRVHFLNPTAVFILELCNGRNSMADIIEVVQHAYGLADAPVNVVSEAVTKMKSEGLLQ